VKVFATLALQFALVRVHESLYTKPISSVPLIAMMTKKQFETYLARLVPRVLVTGAPVEQRQDVRERGCKLRVVVYLRVPL
jgi:hypothetical protein